MLQSPEANAQRQSTNRKTNCLSPLITKSDQHPVSPNKISVQSIEKVTRTIKMINKEKLL